MQLIQAQERESHNEIKISDLNKQILLLNEEKKVSIENAKSSKSSLNKLQLELDEIKLEFKSKIEERDFVEKNLNETISKYKQQVSSLQDDISNIQKLQQTTVVSEESKNENKKLEQKLEEVTQQNLENNKKIMSLQLEVGQKDLELKNVTSQLEEFVQLVESHDKHIVSSEIENKKILQEKENKILQMEKEILEIKQKSEEQLREEIHQYTNKLNKIEQDKKMVEEKLLSTETQLEEEKKRALILKEKQDNSNSRIEELELKLEEAVKNYETVNTDLETALQLNIENARKFERELQITEEGFKLREERRKNNIVKSIQSQASISSPSRWFNVSESLPKANSIGQSDKQGFLNKQGDWVRSWKKKWMVLKGDKIYIYDSPQGEKAKATIDLSSDCFVQRADEYTNMENSFGIYNINLQKKVSFLKADTIEECEDWMECITANIRKINN